MRLLVQNPLLHRFLGKSRTFGAKPVLHQGQTVVEGAVHDLLQCAQVRVRLLVDEPQVTRCILAETMETAQVLEENNGHFVLSMAVEQVPLLNRHLVGAGVTVRALVPMRSLEAYFLSIT